jgi:hypothetical protein
VKQPAFNLQRPTPKRSRVAWDVRCALLVVAWSLLSASFVHAQSPISNLVYTVGTTINSGSQDWSYVVVGSVDHALLRGKRFAVYGKPGAPTNAASFTERGTIARQTDPTVINTLLNQSVAVGQNLSALDNTLAQSVGTNVVGLLHNIPGITNQSLAQKVATAFQLAANDPDVEQALLLLGQIHPGLLQCLGRAFAEPIAGITTYEIRELDPVTGAPNQVVGRVTITPGAVVVLPAPGRAFQVVSNQVAEHLQVRLRWGTPPELRRLSLLNFGFNVWRIARTNAEAGNFHIIPPSPAQLQSNPNFIRANRAPVMATMAYSADTGAGAADDPADRRTYFFADNGSGSGWPAFNDGEEFYFFVTARDLLGRDGLVSTGRLARACRRLPPVPPTGVQVVNTVLAGSTNQPRLQVTWQQNTNATDAVTEYWVYRWLNPTSALTNDTAPISNRVGVVTYLAGTNFNSFTDNTTGSLTNANLTNVWYTLRAVSQAACDPLLSPQSPPAWGVLRHRSGPDATTGEVVGSCGTPAVMLSQVTTNALGFTNSEGRRFRFVCVRRDPGIAWVEFEFPPPPGSFFATKPFNRIYFPPGGDRLDVDYIAPVEPVYGLSVLCYVGNAQDVKSPAAGFTTPTTNAHPYNSELQIQFLAGQLLATALNANDPLLIATMGGSDCRPATSVAADPSGMVSMRFDFNAGQRVLVQAQTNGVWFDVATVSPDPTGAYWVSYPACLIGPLPPFRGCRVNLPAESNCEQHISIASPDGAIAPLRPRFRLTPRTREYRVYRRINDGPLTLVAQGAANYDPNNQNKIIEATDDAMPPSPARLCYFVQLLDEHGNGSPLAFIGCKEVKPGPLPVPTLSEPASAGTVTQPQVALNWFCPTAGVYRFQFKLQIADSQGGTQPSGFAGSQLLRDVRFNQTVQFAGVSRSRPSISSVVGRLATLTRFDEAHLTSPIGPNFGPGPGFTLTADVRANTTYLISVAAVDEQGNVGPSSVAWTFTWQAPLALQNVPWPARPLPTVNYYFVGARILTNWINSPPYPNLYPRYPVGVTIGGYQVQPFVYDYGLTNSDYIPVQPPTSVLTKNEKGQSVLPCVLYRTQVTNSLFPRVSGDITQVSPLLETIAWRNPCLSGTFDGPCTSSYLRDPLVKALYRTYPAFPGEGTLYAFDLYLLDTQPVISGARYRYLLVRFNSKREPEEIIPAGEVDIP